MGLFNLFGNKDKNNDAWKKNHGTLSKPRTTKTRVVWDYMTPDGRKGCICQSKSSYLLNKKNKKFWKD